MFRAEYDLEQGKYFESIVAGEFPSHCLSYYPIHEGLIYIKK